MKSKRNGAYKVVLGLVLPIALIAGVHSANARPPRAGSATVARTGPAGNTSTRRSSVTTNRAGGFSAQSTYTGPAGNTTSRQQSGSYNAATQTYTRAGTTTYPNGQSANFSSSTQATGNGYTHNATRTGPNGNALSTTGQGTYNPATGTFNQSRTSTGPNGNSATENRSVTLAPVGQPHD